MGRPKALLPLPAGDCFLSRLTDTFWMAGVPRVVAVLGHDSAKIRRALNVSPRLDVVDVASPGRPDRTLRLVDNRDPSRGQLSSLLVAIDLLCQHPPTPAAVLVTPVDLPLLAADTVRRVVAAWRRTAAPIVRPVCERIHGHPVLFGAAVFDELRRGDPSLGARAVVQAHQAGTVDVEVTDAGAFDDIDTPEDYLRLIGVPLQE